MIPLKKRSDPGYRMHTQLADEEIEPVPGHREEERGTIRESTPT
jgi:hypothetical protein